MVDELKVKIIPDISELKSKLSDIGVISGGGSLGKSGSAAGGVASKLLTGILLVLAKILAPLLILGAFYEAVGPIMKVLFKTLSAIILILLTPFLRLFLPLLRTGIPALIDFAKQTAESIQKFLDAFNLPKAFKKLSEGDVFGFFQEIFIGLIPGITHILASMPWVDIVTGIIDFLRVIDWKSILDIIIEFVQKDILGNLPEPIKKALSDLVEAIDTGKRFLFGVGGEGGVWQKLIGAVLDAKVALINVFNTIISALSGVATSIFNLPLIGGIIKGLVGGGGGGLGPTGGLIGAGPTGSGAFGSVARVGLNDFISRPGQAPVSFNPNDTIIGTKGGLGGGTTINNTFNISPDVDSGSLRRAIEAASREMFEEAKRQGTFVQRTFNV